MKIIMIPTVFVFMLTSCVNTKKTTAVWIPKNQTYYERKNGNVANPNDYIYTHRLTSGAKARVTLPALPPDVLVIKFVEDVTKKSTTDNSKTRLTDSGDPAAQGNYVPGQIDIPPGIDPDESFLGPKFKYVEYKHIIQTLSIPLKFRPKIRDTIRSAASAAFNVGLAYAFKFTVNTYRKIYWKNNGSAAPLSNLFNKFTYAIGPFAGPTVIDLKSANTDGKLKKDRSIVGLTYGIFGVIGYNEFNVGLALGLDTPFGADGKPWIYKNKPWVGFVVALDIIK